MSQGNPNPTPPPEHSRFKPGRSPYKAPKGVVKKLKDKLAEPAKRKKKKPELVEDEIVENIVNNILNKNSSRHLEILLDRIYGKVSQPVDVNATASFVINIVPIDPKDVKKDFQKD